MKKIVVTAVSVFLMTACDAGDQQPAESGSVKSDRQPEEIVTIELNPADAVLAEKFTKLLRYESCPRVGFWSPTKRRTRSFSLISAWTTRR